MLQYDRIIKCQYNTQYTIHATKPAISLGQVKAAQEMSKNEFTAHAKKTLDAANAAHQSAQKASKSTATKVGMEIEV